MYVSSSCARGVYSFPLSILSDQRQPYQRAAEAIAALIGITPMHQRAVKEQHIAGLQIDVNGLKAGRRFDIVGGK